MKYRIRMDGNGEFVVERKTFLRWFPLVRTNVYVPLPNVNWSEYKGRPESEWLASYAKHFEFDTPPLTKDKAFRFSEVVHAVQVLQIFKARDQRERNKHKLSTIVKEAL